jgi:single-stranded-DNA-specific exonuclease
LLEENRIFVREGLQILSECPRPGLKALLDVAGGPTNGTLDARDLAFRLAPRLNAAGRLGSGSIGCELLTTMDAQDARRISQKLDAWNTTRKDLENNMLSDILALLEEDPGLAKDAIVLDAAHWHEGVMGIVASRLIQRYLRPVVLIAVRDGLGKGSARSPEGFDLYEALQACSSVLDRFGGHKAAAGLALRVENIATFRSMFHRIVAEKLREKDLTPALHIDTEIAPEEICPDLVNDLERLAPFGQGNPEPLFVLSDLHVLSAQTVGNAHVKMRLTPRTGNRSNPLECIFFDAPFQGETPRHFHRVACHVRWNRWMDRQLPQLIIKDFA